MGDTSKIKDTPKFLGAHYIFPIGILFVFFVFSALSISSMITSSHNQLKWEYIGIIETLSISFAQHVKHSDMMRLQQDIDLIAEHDERVIRLSYIGRKADENYYHLASNWPSRIDTPAHTEDLDVISHGAPVILHEHRNGNQYYDITYPVSNDEGMVIGCIGYTAVDNPLFNWVLIGGYFIFSALLFTAMLLHFMWRSRVMAQLLTESKASQRMKEEFITTISHELRTPLTSVLVSLGMLKTNMQKQLPEQAQKLITLAHSNSRRLVRLISDILDIEKIKAGKMTFHIEPLELITLVHRVIEDSNALAEEARVSMSCQTLVTDDRIKGDADRLMQALTNLLSNAIKYSPPGESVEVVVREQGPMLRIEVTDHGPGIPEEYHGQIFKKFAQIELPEDGGKAGTGLGLNIARLIVQQHGGRIDFQSSPGVGTVFFIDLPRAVQDLPTLEPEIPNVSA